MAFCSNCGGKLTDGAQFCSACGTSVHIETYTIRQVVYDGEIHKCPNCGEILNSFAANCLVCGYELRNVKTNNSVNKLVEKIGKAASVDEKIELITNFYVPNTKEDIYDFFILAVSNLGNNTSDTEAAWQAKLEQTYHKAKLSFGKTPEFDYIEKLYNKIQAKVSKKEASSFSKKNKLVCIYGFLVGTGLVALTIGIILILNGNNQAGALLLLFSIFFMLSPTIVSLYITDEEKKPEKKKTPTQGNHNYKVVEKDADEYIHEQFENVAEQFRELGFMNIVTRAEKKGLFGTEGAVKDISIAGNSEFSKGDKFNLNSKVIIRYYSRNC